MGQKLDKVKNALVKSAGWSLFTMFVWELVEEGLESLIAYWISGFIVMFAVKSLATIGIIFTAKKLCVRFLTPIIRNLTYKKGNDKMTKIKNFFAWIYANKKSLLGVVSGAVATLSGTGVIDISRLPCLNIGSFNVTTLIYYGALLILMLVGVAGKGFESVKTFFERIAQQNAEKEQSSIIKEAKKEIKQEKKLANQTQAEQEKEQAKAEAKAKAQAEKEKADAEHKAKVEQAKAELIAQEQSANK